MLLLRSLVGGLKMFSGSSQWFSVHQKNVMRILEFHPVVSVLVSVFDSFQEEILFLFQCEVG